MQRTPDAIIAEFEFRQRTANDARRKRFLHRAIDIAQIALALVALIVVTDRVAPPASKPYAIFVGVLVFSFLSHEVQKRWVLEDRIGELEQKLPNQTPEPIPPQRDSSF